MLAKVRPKFYGNNMTDFNPELDGERSVPEDFNAALRAFMDFRKTQLERLSGGYEVFGPKPPYIAPEGAAIEVKSHSDAPLIVEKHDEGEWRYLSPQADAYRQAVDYYGTFRGTSLVMAEDFSIWTIGGDGDLRVPVGTDAGQAAFLREEAARTTSVFPE